MLIYCPVTGLPIVGSPNATYPKNGINSTDAPFPDLLESQKAQIRLTSNNGVSSIHQVHCSVQIKGDRPYPSPDRQEIVICPSSGEELRLLRLLVIHDIPRSRVVLRLPASFRSRVYSVLSWWFETLSQSSRAVIPSYALTPEIEFIPETITHSKSDSPKTQAPKTQAPKTQAPKTQAPKTQAPKTQAPKTQKPQTDTSAKEFSRAQTPLSTSSPKKKEPSKSFQISATESQEKAASFTSPKPSEEKELLKSKEAPSTFTSAPQEKQSPTTASELSPPSEPLLPDFSDEDEEAPTIMGTAFEKEELDQLLASTQDDDDEDDISSEKTTSSPSAEDLPEEEKGTIQRPAIDLPLPPSKKKQSSLLNKQELEPSVDEVLSDLLKTTASPTQEQQHTLEELPDEEEFLPDLPTVSRPAPAALAELLKSDRKLEELDDDELILEDDQIISEDTFEPGIQVFPEIDPPEAFDRNLKKWQKRQTPYWFEADPSTQSCHVYFKTPPESTKILDQGGQVSFFFQLHRLATFPLIVLLLLIQDEEQQNQTILYCPIDADDPNSLMFLDLLMQDFTLHISLFTDDYKIHRKLKITQPLEQNVEYLLNEARNWKKTIGKSLNFKKAIEEFEAPDYDKLGKMTHNFSEDSFIVLDSPSMTRLAAGIVSYWSQKEQADYLIAIKSFPLQFFKEIQHRVITASLDFGIYLTPELQKIAIEMGLASSEEEVLKTLLSSFAELNLNIQQLNDLDPWDNLDNWQKLFEACDERGIEIDEDIEELAAAAERACNEEEELELDPIDEYEAFADYHEMEIPDLLELLNDPEQRTEAAIALVHKNAIEHIEEIAAIFPQLDQEEVFHFMDAFISFGEETEPYLISWLPLPRSYQREAAMLGLGTMGSTKAIEPIIKRLRSGEEWETAADALGLIGEPAIPYLAKEIKNKNWLIRLRALKALSRIDDSAEALRLIETLVDDPNDVVRSEAANILNL